MKTQYVNYYRVSTTRQQISGLGLEAQRDSVARYLSNANGIVIAEFTEIESGKRADRPELEKAINLCKLNGFTLCVAKLDRLARNLHFVTTLQQSKVNFVAVDNQHASPLMIHILCAFAEAEAVAISARTKSALEACKRRGQRLGNPNYANAVKLAAKANQAQADRYSERLLPVIREIQQANVKSLRGIAHCLNVRGYLTRTGKRFHAATVSAIIDRSKD